MFRAALYTDRSGCQLPGNERSKLYYHPWGLSRESTPTAVGIHRIATIMSRNRFDHREMVSLKINMPQINQDSASNLHTRILIVNSDRQLLDRYQQAISPTAGDARPEAVNKAGKATENLNGFRINLAESEQSAILSVTDAIKQQRPFVIVLLVDQKPSTVDCISLARRVRLLDKEVNIVIVSDNPDIESDELCRTVPPTDKLFYLHSPVHTTELRQLSLALAAKWIAESEARHTQQQLISTIADRTVQLNESKSNYGRLYRRYRTLYHQTPSMFFTIDRKTRIVSVNDFAISVLGYPYEDLIQIKFSDLHKTIDRKLVQTLIQDATQQPECVHRQEVRILREDNREIWVRETVRLTDEKSEEQQLLIVCEDISDRIEKEAEASNLGREYQLLLQKSLAIQEEERKNLAREIHDELGQSLTAIQADAEFIRKRAGNDNRAITQSASTIMDLTSQIYHTAHSIMERLRPAALGGFGLDHALTEVIENWRFRYPGINWTIEFEGDLGSINENQEISIYRIVQESLTNISRHAAASEVKLLITVVGQGNHQAGGHKTLKIQIVDNGIGFDPSSQKTGLGLIGIRERVRSLHGEFSILSPPGEGVRLNINIPLDNNQKE